MASSIKVRPVVKLKRFRTVIECPGCKDLFYVEDECAAHLFKNCIQLRSNNTSEFRRNLVTWIVDYFKTHPDKQQNPPDAVKINMLLNDDRFASSSKTRLRVDIPPLSSAITCPVCGSFSYTPEACLEHLFARCLSVANNEILRVRHWLCAYFATKTEEDLNGLRDMLSTYSASRLKCKYCRTEAADRDSLMRHLPCPQQRVVDAGQLMCELCNYSVPNLQQLVSHIISKHYKCHVCGIWPKNRRVDFIAFEHHVRSCDPRRPPFFRCPMCSADVPVRAEPDLSAHIGDCRRERVDRQLDISSLYGKCDVINCTERILLCDVDAHVIKHLRNGDLPSSRHKRLRVSAEDLNYLVRNSFSERKSTNCVCNGIPR